MTIFILLAVVGLLVYIYARIQISELGGHINRAERRVIRVNPAQDQTTLDNEHLPRWRDRLRVMQLLKRAGKYSIFGFLGLFLVFYLVNLGLAWARFYGWIG